MIFEATSVAGAWVVRPQRLRDERGYFTRVWCREEFAGINVNLSMEQASVSYNIRKGTLRGLHYTAAPSAECKLVRCQRGAIFDVIVDLRPESPTYMTHFAIELDVDGGVALFVPQGVAHGFQTLADHSEIHYMMTEAYIAEHARGVRYDDPAFGIRWPLPVSAIHDRDRDYPPFDPDAWRRDGSPVVPH